MWQWHCRNKKKKIGNCGNTIAENGEKKKGYEICEREKKKLSCPQYFYTFFYLHIFLESFNWILLNSKLIYVIGTVPTYLGIWEKRVNFGNTIAEIQQK